MLRLAAPEWLLLIPLLALLGWHFRGLELHRPLRATALLLLVLLLARPELRRLSDGLDLFLLVDRSASAADPIAANLAEWETLLDRSKGPDDRLRVIDFAESPVERDTGTDSAVGNRDATALPLALRHALALSSPDRASRILTLTDGLSTEPLDDIGATLALREVPLDYRWLTPPDAADVGIVSFKTPTRVQPGEPFLIEVDLSGRPDGPVPFELLRDGAVIASSSTDLVSGEARARFTDRLTTPGAHRYQVRLTGNVDAISGNNAAESWTEMTSGPRILLVTRFDPDPAATALTAQGFEVETVTNPRTLDVGRLAGARALVLNDVPASDLPPDFFEAIDFFVRDQSGSLLMTGGRTSFGSGGYFKSPIDELLPVSMELRLEHRKLAVALAIVMDRSGSMAAGVTPSATKMDLANEGAARAIELLGPADAVTVLPTDSKAHVVVPLTRIGENRNTLTDTVRRIQSGGGGIYVYNGLAAAWRELQKANVGQRHVILFADAADSEQPDDYVNLIAEMKTGATTISVIGLGSETDRDAAFLQDIATRAGGRSFFNADPATLPALFEQETVAVARSAFIDEPTAVEPTAGWLELAATPLDWPAAVDGYNLSYLRPEATSAAFTQDEYRAPLVAFWQRGAGRAAAVSFPVSGPDSTQIRAWPRYGDFLQTLARWLIGEALPPGLGLRTQIDGTRLQLDLRFDDSWQERFAKNAPEIVVTDDETSTPRPVTWERLRPGHYQARVQLTPGTRTRGAIRAGDHTLPFGPIATGVNPEWTADPIRRTELIDASRLSGGVERVDLSKVWTAPRRQAFTDLSPYLLFAFLLVFLAEALQTRLR